MRPVVRFGTAADGDLSPDSNAVEERRRRIVGAPWTWLRQVHGSRVIVVRAPGEGAGEEADAAVTAVPGAVLSVLTADCAPVLLASSQGPLVVGAVHAGWRGLYDGVLRAAAEAIEDLGGRGIVARLGPCISPAAYEFGIEDLTTLALRFGPEVVAATAEGRPAFDLPAAVESECVALGIGLDRREWRCTARDGAFFSWRARRDAARQSSVTWIEP